MISLAQAVRALGLLVRNYLRPKAHSYKTEWGMGSMEHQHFAHSMSRTAASPFFLATVSFVLLDFIRSEKYFQIIQNQ